MRRGKTETRLLPIQNRTTKPAMFHCYDKKTFWLSLSGMIALAALMKPTSGAGFGAVFLLMLVAAARRSIVLLLYCLVLSNVALMGNSWFFAKGVAFFFLQRTMMVLVGVSLSLRFFGGGRNVSIAPLMWVLPYIFYMILPSAAGWSPAVSFLKIMLFMLVFVAYAGAANAALSARADISPHLRSMMVAAAAFIILGSVALIPFPSISYLNAQDILNDPGLVADIEAGLSVSLYKGMTWHSQTLGPLTAAFCIFLAGDLLFNIRRADKLYIALILLCPVLIYKTSSRTAMAVLIVGLGFIAVLLRSAGYVGTGWKRKAVAVFNLILIVGLVGVLTIPGVREGIVRYALKSDKKDTNTHFSTEQMMSSRQFLIDAEMENWSRSPWIGNGFQVSEDMAHVGRGGLKEFLTAPVEKGVWVSAVLEEGGMIGLVLFCLFWIPAVLSLWKRRCSTTSALLLSFIVMNMAEFTIFSMSGAGGFLWCVLFMLAILDGNRIRQSRMLAQGSPL